ncbi:MAG: hypothetical protein LBD09_03160 [Treponema sp.]|jgi:hypothetical protein|nr:hypothetical protein [Treponema sp.]
MHHSVLNNALVPGLPGVSPSGGTYRALLPALAVLCALAVSCAGAASSIELAGDGSGRLTLEYRIARELENLGALDGNERWSPVPVGRADMERTAARIPGLRLLSYRVRDEGADRIHRSEFTFASASALNAFFDPAGEGRFVADPSARRIRVRFPGTEAGDPRARSLVREALEGYDFSLSFKVPGGASARWLDGAGNEAAGPGGCSAEGRTARCALPMADLALAAVPLVLEINW